MITGGSVVVALVIGGIETFNLLSERLGLSDHAWALLAIFDASLADFGFALIGLFLTAWLVTVVWHRAALSGHRWSRSFDRAAPEVLEGANTAEVA